MTVTTAPPETVVHDHAQRLVDAGIYTAEGRAEAMRYLASRWDEILRLYRLRYGYDTECVETGLLRCIAEYADPGLTHEQIATYTEALIEACRALTRYELGDGWDGDEDDEKYRYSAETVVGILNTDIDYTLFPLVHGLDESNACRRCERVKRGAAFWNVREPGSAYCAACKAA